MAKINQLEKGLGESSDVESNRENYGARSSYSRGGIKNFILAGSAIIVGLTYGCSLKFHPERVHYPETALDVAAATGKFGKNNLTNKQRHSAAALSRMIERNRNNGEESQEDVNSSIPKVYPNVYRDENGGLHPAPGYEWAYPDKPKTYEVRKKQIK